MRYLAILSYVCVVVSVLFLLGHAIGFDIWYNNKILYCGGAYVKTGLGG